MRVSDFRMSVNERGRNELWWRLLRVLQVDKFMNATELSQKYLIFKCQAGSHAYGMNTANSDQDIRGLFIAPPEYHLGNFQHVEQVEIKSTGEDCVIYELKKFVELASKCNPNIIEMLFTPERFVYHIDPAFEEFIVNRHLFISKIAKFAYSGYAIAQLKRIKGHKKWINQPQSETPPNILDYCKVIYVSGEICLDNLKIREFLQDKFLCKTSNNLFRIFKSEKFSKLPVSEDGVNFQFVDISDEKLFERDGKVEGCGVLVFREDDFKEDRQKWNQYWNWKENRNEVRSKLEEEYNYDTKHAAHLVRLLKMCEEILTTGELIVHRPDAQELLAIRNGSKSYDEIIEWAEAQDRKMDDLYEKSTLQHSPNKVEIDKLYMRVVKQYWNKNVPGWYYP